MTATITITGMKISFDNGYVYGEDELHMVGYTGPVQDNWYAAQGYLNLTGGSSVADYIDAIRKVQYSNNAGKPKPGNRILTFSLIDGDYLPSTGHFYTFISRPNITWTAARAEAATKTYYGLQGYLATITSDEENAFIQTKTNGLGWIGATDQAVEGEWRWVTGPEGALDGGQGLLFWRGSGIQARTNPNSFGPVKNAFGVPAYHNWNRWGANPTGDPLQYEPNDYNTSKDHEEDYAHITYNLQIPSENKKWNDYPNNGGSAGYLIEYGGMPNEPALSMVATINLEVYSLGFGSNSPITKCQGVPVQLNQLDNTASYLWRPATGLSNRYISNPVAKPDSTTEYTVIASIGTCKDSTKFLLNINPAPVSLLKPVEDICTGAKVTLNPGIHSAYLWGTGAITPTITTATGGYFKVKITAPNGCPTTDSSLVVVHQFPKMDLSKLNVLTCGLLTSIVNISSDKGTYIMTNLTNNQEFLGTTISVPSFGDYQFKAHLTDPYNCPSDTTMLLKFHKIPKVDFTIDSTECYGYNLQATYIGDANPPTSRFTWIFGGDTISNKLNQNIEQIPLGVNQTKRDLVLKVTEDGCTGSDSRNDIHVIPDLKIFVKKSLQCQPVPFEFSATNTETVVKYEWDWGDGTKGLGKVLPHHYAKEGYYDVNLVVTTDKGCMNSVTSEKMVYVAPIPTVGFSIDPATCLNQGKDTLNYVGSASNKDTFYWNLKGFDPAEIIQSPDTTAGPFVFDLINKPKTQLSLYVISQYGCRSITSSLEVKRRPVFSFTSSVVAGCAPVPVNFSAKPDDPVDNQTFAWDFGDGSQGSGAMIDHTYETPNTLHDLQLNAVSSVTGCTDSIFHPKYITVHPNPKASFTMDHDIVYNDAPQVIFTDQSIDAINYYWDFGDKTHSREKDPIHSYAVVGKRKVIQTVYNQFDCQDTTSKTVLVAFSRIFAPNAFSPSASKEIDRTFLLSSEGIMKEGYHLTVLSRWNDIVFECKNEIKGWDGKMTNGNYAPSGNYIWILECFDFLGRPHRQSGSLTLVF
ncbi:MAG: PKD domain-containing protein [Prolixibacteraceae bacterium]